MIFLTVGTTKFQFNRLIQAVDETLINLKLREDLIIQNGASDYRVLYNKTRIYKEIPYNWMIEYFSKVRVTITASGPATIFLALKYGKNKPLVVPRSSKLGEHVDEHEVLFSQFLRKEAKVTVVLPSENIKTIVSRYLQLPDNNTDKGEVTVSPGLIKGLASLTADCAK